MEAIMVGYSGRLLLHRRLRSCCVGSVRLFGYGHPAVPIPPGRRCVIRRVILEEVIPYDGGPPEHRASRRRDRPLRRKERPCSIITKP